MRETFAEFLENMSVTERDELIENIIDSLLFLPEEVQISAVTALDARYPALGKVAEKSLTV